MLIKSTASLHGPLHPAAAVFDSHPCRERYLLTPPAGRTYTPEAVGDATVQHLQHLQHYLQVA
eukprot:358736-Chlamydomonas_euryale.AAC.5